VTGSAGAVDVAVQCMSVAVCMKTWFHQLCYVARFNAQMPCGLCRFIEDLLRDLTGGNGSQVPTLLPLW